MKKSIFVFLVSLLFFACSGEENIEKWPEKGNYYDPAKPVSFEALSPSWGRIDQTFLIKGHFPTDVSQIKVYFNNKRAVVINSDGKELFGLVPKQAPGDNNVALVVGNDSIVPDNIQFRYYQTQSVKTVVGKDEDDQEYTEGSLEEARLGHWEVVDLGVVDGKNGDNLLVAKGAWQTGISLVSFDDNKMIKAADIGWMGSVAVDNTKEKAYLIPRNGDRTIQTLSREDGWSLTNSTGIVINGNDLRGDMVGGGAVFTENDRYLYLMSAGDFVEVDLEEKEYKILFKKEDISAFNGKNLGTWWVYLTYSKFHKCFFASYADANGIFKIYKDGNEWKVEEYAGFKAGNKTVLGDRLNDAVLRAPTGMAVTDDGEIYVALKSAHCIVKISGRLVTLVAGKPDEGGRINGYPTDARFDQPTAIAIDSEGNFFISSAVDRMVRKLTIE